MILNKKQKNKAFTLIELMVASTLFTIVMMMGVGSLIVSSNSAKASQKLRIAVDNVNFAMESMARELRTGTYYYCGTGNVSMTDDKAVKDCTGGDVILFKPQQVPSTLIKRVGYYKEARKDGSNTYTLLKCEENANCYPIVSSDVNVETLKFYVTGADGTTKNVQPSVEILMKGNITTKEGITSFSLQTMASQRSTEK